MKVGVVDIGTNSMRLLITDGSHDERRWVEVTGLGRGVDASGRLDEAAVEESIIVLGRFGALMSEAGVDRRSAVATSATRDAANRDMFLDRAERALGVRPLVVSGPEEGRLSYEGATTDLSPRPWLVSDIGGGSTEFVSEGLAQSIDIGSVRLTDRVLRDRPPSDDQVNLARDAVSSLLKPVQHSSEHVLAGVAGTWTSLGAMDLGLDAYERHRVHHHRLTAARLEVLIADMQPMTVGETIASYPSLDPKRAPVILAGGVIASCVMSTLGVGEALICERDSLDGLARRTLALA